MSLTTNIMAAGALARRLLVASPGLYSLTKVHGYFHTCFGTWVGRDDTTPSNLGKPTVGELMAEFVDDASDLDHGMVLTYREECLLRDLIIELHSHVVGIPGTRFISTDFVPVCAVEQVRPSRKISAAELEESLAESLRLLPAVAQRFAALAWENGSGSYAGQHAAEEAYHAHVSSEIRSERAARSNISGLTKGSYASGHAAEESYNAHVSVVAKDDRGFKANISAIMGGSYASQHNADWLAREKASREFTKSVKNTLPGTGQRD